MQLAEVVTSLDAYVERRQQLREAKAFPTGSLGLDLALGGGWRRGWMAELSGDYSSYKSSLAYHTVAQVQRGGGLVLWLDSASDFNPPAARAAGVRIDNLAYGTPSDALDAMGMIQHTAPFMHLIVVDSANGLDVREGVDWAKRFAYAKTELATTTVLFLNSVKTIRNPFTEEVKKWASQRVRLTPLDVHRVQAEVKRNNLLPPALFDIKLQFQNDATIDVVWELVTLATQLGVIEKRGSWSYFQGRQLGQGVEGAIWGVCGLGLADQIHQAVVTACA